MRNCTIILALVVLTVVLTGCVQPRVSSPEYGNPYGDTSYSPSKRWWGEERPRGDVDVDKFLWRWRGLTQ